MKISSAVGRAESRRLASPYREKLATAPTRSQIVSLIGEVRLDGSALEAAHAAVLDLLHTGEKRKERRP